MYAPTRGKISRFAADISQLQRFGIRPDLERTRALLEHAGQPHRSFPHLLIGGTNGKGSTAEGCARLLAHKGRRIGLFTSPHLYKWNERIRILPGTSLGDEAQLFQGSISDAELDALWDEVKPHVETVANTLGQPTEFEVVTFLGLCYFARQNVDAAVLEVGLGGKWDATNATDPQTSVVTHVALDHCDRLGNTLEEIAADKVQIARPNRPFLTLETKPNVLRVLEDGCAQIVARFERLESDAADFQTDFQTRNLALARAASERFCQQLGWPFEPHPIQLRVPGRLEEISSRPRVIVDGANNPDGAANLAQQLGVPRKNLVLVLGILKDKDWRAMTEILAPLARTIICTQTDSPRALAAAELAAEAARWNTHVETQVEIKAALDRATQLAGENDTILITGSFTLLGEVPRPFPNSFSAVSNSR